MRVTKEPEVRKQEILDTALKLFGENGYEKTSITDIAKDEWNLYEQFGSIYTKYADEHPLRYPDQWEWEEYKEEFLTHADEYDKELKRKELDKKYQLCLNFEDL